MPDTLSSLADFADRCNSCNENRYTIDVKDGTVRAIFCRDCFHPCPACEGEEHVYYEDNHGYRYVDRCRVCGALADRITAFNRCGVPARYGLARLQSFVTTQDDSKCHRQSSPRSNCRSINGCVGSHRKTAGSWSMVLWEQAKPICWHRLSITSRWKKAYLRVSLSSPTFWEKYGRSLTGDEANLMCSILSHLRLFWPSTSSVKGGERIGNSPSSMNSSQSDTIEV